MRAANPPSAAPPRIGLLGPVRAGPPHRPLDVGGPQQRTVLAVLALECPRVVGVPRLIGLLWGDHPPRTAAKNLQGHVCRLRRALTGVPGVAVATCGPGYSLDTELDDIDLHRFRRLVAAVGRERDVEQQRTTLREALRLWRGPALANARSDELAALAAALEEEHVAAREQLLVLEVQHGAIGTAIGELRALVAAYPLREGTRALLMWALARDGRRADALTVYAQGRDILAADLGLEPGPRLQHMHRRALRGDPGCDPAPIT